MSPDRTGAVSTDFVCRPGFSRRNGFSLLRSAGVVDTLGGQWIFPATITRCELMTVMERNP